MVEGSETRYTRSGKLNVAYRTFGEGPIDVLIVPNWITNVDLLFELEPMAGCIQRLTRFARAIVFDCPGTGCSDPVALDALPTLEQWMDSVRAVLDAVESSRVAIMAQDAGFLSSALFAATFPERTAALIACGAWARLQDGDGYEQGHSREVLAATKRTWVSMHGTAGWQRVISPEMIRTEEERKRWARFERNAVPPGTLRVLIDLMFGADVRHVLPVIQTPTLVIHAERDPVVSFTHGRYIADHIDGARMLSIPAADHYVHLRRPDIVDEHIRSFVLEASRMAAAPSERILATALFTDIVDSTARAAQMGDASWREVIARHDDICRSAVAAHAGRSIKSTGDGWFAIFDGPARAIRCAREITTSLAAVGIDVRAGLHTGECEILGDDVVGLAVNIAARIEAMATAGEVLASSTVKDLVTGSGITFEDRGAHTLKGVPGEWRVFAVV